MNPPLRNPLTNDLQLHVSWNQLASDELLTGGSAIISYGLEISEDPLATTWTPLIGFNYNVLQTEFIIQTNIVKQGVYYVRLSAKNIYGWGPPSEYLEIAAAGIPE